MSIQPASPRVIPAHPSNYGDRENMPLKWYVIHSAVCPCEPGMAEKVSRQLQEPDLEKSWHYMTDPETTVQPVGDSFVAYHCGFNPHSLGHEMADTPGPVPNDPPGTAAWKAAKKSWRWVRPNQIKMLNKVARVTARNCLAYGIPLRYVGPRGLKKNKKGITTHAAMSKAFKKSTHWDPGFWPRRIFILLVQNHARIIKRKAKKNGVNL